MMELDTSAGAITRVPGFEAAGVSCGLKEGGQPDLALVVCDREATTAATFTSNAFKAAPVLYDSALLSRSESGVIRAVVANAGIANACTGEQGDRDAHQMARLTENMLGFPPNSVFVMSTGVIGKLLPMDQIEAGIRSACQALSPSGGAKAAKAIMTTDLVPKEASIQFKLGEAIGSIGGMAKGSGMIHPDLVLAGSSPNNASPLHATMLSAIVTDVNISRNALNGALSKAVDTSFNRITVDGDTSTNDTVVLLAGSQADNVMIEIDTPSYTVFENALVDVCQSLAKQIAGDGEGATRLVEIVVEGAVDHAQAVQAAKTVATSPLVKTAIFGTDPNWGRVLAAVGRSGAQVIPSRTGLWLEDIQLVEQGRPIPFDEEAARMALSNPEVRFTVHLGMGEGYATVWTCDLSYKYVEINAEYHT